MSKFTTLVASAALVLSAVAAPAFAADDPSTPAQELNPWVDCGIGAMVFPTTPVGAVISNVIWDYGITATTSAASSRTTCEGSRVKTAMFINTNYASLVAETAAGRGEHLDAMAQLMNCAADSRAQVIADVRAAMPAAMSVEGFDRMAETNKAQAFFKVVDTVAKTSGAACNMA